MKKIIFIVAAVLVLVFVQGCNPVEKAKNIKLANYEVKGFNPSGLRSADLDLALEIDNPSITFNIESMEAVIKHAGDKSEFLTATGGPLKIKRKSRQTYETSVKLSLGKGTSLLGLMSALTRFDAKKYTVDINACVKAKGIRKNVSYKDYPLEKLMGGLNK